MTRIHLYLALNGVWIATQAQERVEFNRLRYETYEEAAIRAGWLLSFSRTEG